MQKTDDDQATIKKTPLSVPSYSRWKEDELAKFTANEFMQALYHRAKDVGDDLYDSGNYEFIVLEPEVYKAALVTYMRRRAWSEWYFGTVSPARQIILLPGHQVDLKLRLAKQIRDEMRHYDVFEQQLRRFGSEPRISDFELPAILIQMQTIQEEVQSASEVAATNQFAGEIVLSSMTDLKTSIFKKLFDEELMNAVYDIEKDEPHHIANGRDLVLLYCDTVEHRRRLASAQEKYLKAMMQLHVTEIVKLGCCRTNSIPVFDEN